MSYEYKILTNVRHHNEYTSEFIPVTEKQLNEASELGWELMFVADNKAYMKQAFTTECEPDTTVDQRTATEMYGNLPTKVLRVRFQNNEPDKEYFGFVSVQDFGEWIEIKHGKGTSRIRSYLVASYDIYDK